MSCVSSLDVASVGYFLGYFVRIVNRLEMLQVGDLGFADELGNYAEYSGAPNAEETLHFARALIDVSFHRGAWHLHSLTLVWS